MSIPQIPQNSLRARRLARRWSQQELADRSGLSRAGISAIEAGRLSPAVTAALALAQALGCSVEELFAPHEQGQEEPPWALPPQGSRPRYWHARVGDRMWAYPAEESSPQLDWHDGVFQADQPWPEPSPLAERTLVVACCDPAAGLLAAEYARQFQFRMIILQRSSRAALDLLAQGKVHVAGVHLASSRDRSENGLAARSLFGEDCQLVRVARWDEGLAIGERFTSTSLAGILRAKARWVGREPGSGARQCQDKILHGLPAPRRIASDHRGVAAAVRDGWADVGPCVRMASEESGLRFLKVAEKDYDLCFASATEHEPRLAALLATIRSHHYRSHLADLPGYTTSETGVLL